MIELDETDFVLEPSRPRLHTPRITLDEEDDVIGECLAEISASASRSSVRSITPTTVPSPPAARWERPSTPPSSSRLPAVTAPPFVRPSSPIFTRTKAVTDKTPLTIITDVRKATSVAPVSMPTNEPTVILVRERPRTAWIVASAAVGALCALVATRVFSGDSEAPKAAAPPPPAMTQVATAVTAPPPPPAVIKFTDDDGLAIAAPPVPTQAPVAPKPKPIATAPKPVVTVAPPPPSQRPLTPDPPREPKKPLTPEQQLAEAQLKASMR